LISMCDDTSFIYSQWLVLLKSINVVALGSL
jgi:hypothetical protein